MNNNILPPHVIQHRLEHQGKARHQDGRSWECRVCTKIIDATWSPAFAMWLPRSGYWQGKPNEVELAFCCADCSLAWKQSRDILKAQKSQQDEKTRED